MYNVYIGPIIEMLVLLLPAFFCFKDKSEFLSCFYSFMYVGTHRSSKTQENRSVKFAMYFAIVLICSFINIILFL
jgi:hypothetical protein